jgi:cystathionine gamma-synthase
LWNVCYLFFIKNCVFIETRIKNSTIWVFALLKERFPYLDTLKLQEKFGVGVEFFGKGDAKDLSSLKEYLQHFKIAALYCEFPSNPLLCSPQLKELWNLAQEHDFLVIVDETIGNFVNINVLPYCHLLVSSLTKVFSGDSNVMGGSMVINPNSNQKNNIFEKVQELYEDCLWGHDAIFLERNSRCFQRRIQIMNQNAERLCDALKNHPKGIIVFI